MNKRQFPATQNVGKSTIALVLCAPRPVLNKKGLQPKCDGRKQLLI
jgi:hypothetical protein